MGRDQNCLAAIGRYVFNPEIFDHLRHQPARVGGEMRLSDAINDLAEIGKVDAMRFEGWRYDCGSKFEYLEAIVDHALAHPEFGGRFVELITEKVGSLGQASTGT